MLKVKPAKLFSVFVIFVLSTTMLVPFAVAADMQPQKLNPQQTKAKSEFSDLVVSGEPLTDQLIRDYISSQPNDVQTELVSIMREMSADIAKEKLLEEYREHALLEIDEELARLGQREQLAELAGGSAKTKDGVEMRLLSKGELQRWQAGLRVIRGCLQENIMLDKIQIEPTPQRCLTVVSEGAGLAVMSKQRDPVARVLTQEYSDLFIIKSRKTLYAESEFANKVLLYAGNPEKGRDSEFYSFSISGFPSNSPELQLEIYDVLLMRYARLAPVTQMVNILGNERSLSEMRLVRGCVYELYQEKVPDVFGRLSLLTQEPLYTAVSDYSQPGFVEAKAGITTKTKNVVSDAAKNAFKELACLKNDEKNYELLASGLRSEAVLIALKNAKRYPENQKINAAIVSLDGLLANAYDIQKIKSGLSKRAAFSDNLFTNDKGEENYEKAYLLAFVNYQQFAKEAEAYAKARGAISGMARCGIGFMHGLIDPANIAIIVGLAGATFINPALGFYLSVGSGAVFAGVGAAQLAQERSTLSNSQMVEYACSIGAQIFMVSLAAKHAKAEFKTAIEQARKEGRVTAAELAPGETVSLTKVGKAMEVGRKVSRMSAVRSTLASKGSLLAKEYQVKLNLKAAAAAMKAAAASMATKLASAKQKLSGRALELSAKTAVALSTLSILLTRTAEVARAGVGDSLKSTQGSQNAPAPGAPAPNVPPAAPGAPAPNVPPAAPGAPAPSQPNLGTPPSGVPPDWFSNVLQQVQQLTSNQVDLVGAYYTAKGAVLGAIVFFTPLWMFSGNLFNAVKTHNTASFVLTLTGGLFYWFFYDWSVKQFRASVGSTPLIGGALRWTINLGAATVLSVPLMAVGLVWKAGKKYSGEANPIDLLGKPLLDSVKSWVGDAWGNWKAGAPDRALRTKRSQSLKVGKDIIAAQSNVAQAELTFNQKNTGYQRLVTNAKSLEAQALAARRSGSDDANALAQRAQDARTEAAQFKLKELDPAQAKLDSARDKADELTRKQQKIEKEINAIGTSGSGHPSLPPAISFADAPDQRIDGSQILSGLKKSREMSNRINDALFYLRKASELLEGKPVEVEYKGLRYLAVGFTLNPSGVSVKLLKRETGDMFAAPFALPAIKITPGAVGVVVFKNRPDVQTQLNLASKQLKDVPTDFFVSTSSLSSNSLALSKLTLAKIDLRTAVDRFRQKYASEGLSYGGSKKFLLDVMLYTDQNDQVEVLLMLTPDEKAAQSGIGYVDAQKSDVELVPPFRITSLSGSAKKTFLKEVNELYAKIQDVQSHESALLNPVGAMFKVKMKSSGNVGLAPGIYWPSPEDPRIVEVLTLDKDESKQQLVQVLPEDVWYVDRVQFNDKAA